MAHLIDWSRQIRADVIVVGGGLIGLCSAYELSLRGFRVCLVEAGELGAEQSSRNWGFVRQQGRAEEELSLMKEANTIWHDLENELGVEVDWIQGGNLRLTDKPDLAKQYEQWIQLAREYGVESHPVTEEEVRTIVPGFAKKFLFGIYTTSDGQADPTRTVRAYARAARAKGVELRDHVSARALVTDAGRICGILTDDGFIPGDVVVCAAGVGSRALLRGIGLNLPIQVMRETVASTTPVVHITDTCVWTGDLGFRQTSSSGFICSLGGEGDANLSIDSVRAIIDLPTFLPMYLKNRDRIRLRSSAQKLLANRGGKDQDHVSRPVCMSDVRRAINGLERYFPTIEWRVASAWSGIIDGTPDGLPVIEAVESPRGLVIATGMSGHGFGIAPSVGRTVARLVASENVPHNLRPFALGRFREARSMEAHHLL